jgi:hypothetical protein
MGCLGRLEIPKSRTKDEASATETYAKFKNGLTSGNAGEAMDY